MTAESIPTRSPRETKAVTAAELDAALDSLGDVQMLMLSPNRVHKLLHPISHVNNRAHVKPTNNTKRQIQTKKMLAKR